MRDGVWRGMLAANGGYADIVRLSSLGQGIVTTVKVLSLLALHESVSNLFLWGSRH